MLQICNFIKQSYCSAMYNLYQYPVWQTNKQIQKKTKQKQKSRMHKIDQSANTGVMIKTAYISNSFTTTFYSKI